MMLFTLVVGFSTKVGIVRLIDEFGKIVRCIHDTALSINAGKDLVAIRYPSTDRANAKIHYPYFSSGPGEPLYLLGDLVITAIYVCDSRKAAPEDGESGARSRKGYSNVNAVRPDLTVSAATVPSSVHPAESETLVAASIGEGSTNVSEAVNVFNKTLSEKIDDARPVKVAFIALIVSALDDNAGKFESVRQFSREKTSCL